MAVGSSAKRAFTRSRSSEDAMREGAGASGSSAQPRESSVSATTSAAVRTTLRALIVMRLGRAEAHCRSLCYFGRHSTRQIGRPLRGMSGCQRYSVASTQMMDSPGFADTVLEGQVEGPSGSTSTVSRVMSVGSSDGVAVPGADGVDVSRPLSDESGDSDAQPDSSASAAATAATAVRPAMARR